jgi:hypothetical protein
MNRRRSKTIPFVLIITLAAASVAVATLAGTSTAAQQPIPFADARMIIEVNETDGDAGFQIFADAEPWRKLEVFRPDGSRIVNFQADSVLRDFGLTELFSESNEPPFDEFSLADFKALFPAGTYRFRGETTEGQLLVGSAPFSHKIPRGPKVLSPQEDSTIGRADAEVRWRPATQPQGVKVVRYQVIVEGGDPSREFSVFLHHSARSVEIPEQFLARNTEYEGEVLAIEASGNQTITQVGPFRTR